MAHSPRRPAMDQPHCACPEPAGLGRLGTCPSWLRLSHSLPLFLLAPSTGLQSLRDLRRYPPISSDTPDGARAQLHVIGRLLLPLWARNAVIRSSNSRPRGADLTRNNREPGASGRNGLPGVAQPGRPRTLIRTTSSPLKGPGGPATTAGPGITPAHHPNRYPTRSTIEIKAPRMARGWRRL